MPQPKDLFANKFYGTVTESAANTLTFGEIQTNVNLMSRTAWVVHRLEWFLDEASIGRIVASGDALRMALTSSNKMSSLGLDDPGVVDILTLSALAIGAAASGLLENIPYIRDFSRLPGGGLIVVPRPLYVAAEGVSLGAAITIELRGYFTQRELSDSEWFDLIDFYRILS